MRYLSAKLILTALTIASTMFVSSASAFDPADLQKLTTTGDCMKCDLEGADLRGVDLWGANLENVDLSAVNLREAKLNYAIMNDATLCNTIMPDGSVIYSGC